MGQRKMWVGSAILGGHRKGFAQNTVTLGGEEGENGGCQVGVGKVCVREQSEVALWPLQ